MRRDKENLFIGEQVSHFKTAVGIEFSSYGIWPSISSNCTYSCESTSSSTLPPLAWDNVAVTMRAPCVQGAGREIECCCHVLPATSIQAAQPFLVCHFVMGNVRQLAAQTSDCFLVFAFSFIYYSFFLLVLDVCKSSCFEL